MNYENITTKQEFKDAINRYLDSTIVALFYNPANHADKIAHSTLMMKTVEQNIIALFLDKNHKEVIEIANSYKIRELPSAIVLKKAIIYGIPLDKSIVTDYMEFDTYISNL